MSTIMSTHFSAKNIVMSGMARSGWTALRRRRRLSEMEIARIKSLKLAGVPRKQIEQLTGHSRATVKKYSRGVRSSVRYSSPSMKRHQMRSDALTLNQTVELYRLLVKLKRSGIDPSVFVPGTTS